MQEENTAPAPDLPVAAPLPDATPEPAPAPDPVAAEAAPEETKPKKRRAKRTPRFKDWIRVQKSGGNACKNHTIHLIINKANNTCSIVTNAPEKEDDDGNQVGEGMEGERRQIVEFTSFEVVDIPDPEPKPEPATEPTS